MKYKEVKNCRWANEEHTVINCEVDFDDLIEEFVPFSASLEDKYSHTQDIFRKALAGEFGKIEEYVAPILPALEEIQAPIKEAILALNPNAKFPNDADANSDGVATTEEMQAYLKYLQEKALLSKFEG